MEGRWGERLGAAQDEPRALAAAAGERWKSAGGRWVTWPVLPGDHAVTKGRRLGHSDPTAGLSGTLHPGEGMRMWLWQSVNRVPSCPLHAGLMGVCTVM